VPDWSRAFVRTVERLNYRVGRFAMYLLFVLMGILLWSSVSTAVGTPSLWTLEMAQFVMVAYYILGGPYSMQMGSHVRMDLFYANWSPYRKAMLDAFTVLALIFYLGVMVWGAVDSIVYSLGLKWSWVDVEWLPFDLPRPQTGFMERSPTAWRPYLWPIKAILVLGFVLMLLQALAQLVRDIAVLRGDTIEDYVAP
jgi:TRAP-type mannitol/chloroaromatic compound transport system permease small subunit